MAIEKIEAASRRIFIKTAAVSSAAGVSSAGTGTTAGTGTGTTAPSKGLGGLLL